MLVTYFSLNCLHSFTTSGKLESHKNNENIVLLLKTPNKKKTKKNEKCDQVQSITCSDLECLIEKIDACKNNSEKQSTTKVGKHIPSSFQCI